MLAEPTAGRQVGVNAAHAGARRPIRGRGVAIVYFFPKDDAIVLEDKEVEFITEVGGVTIKKEFTLEDMVFNDQLEL